MQNFLNPKSIAIIGASETKNKIGNILLENLAANKKIKIYPVNPSHQKIGDKKCYPSVLDIEKEVDLAVIAIPAKFVPKAVEECAWKAEPIKNIVIISAGFSEIGKQGMELEKKIKKLATENKLNILGPNCLGVINVQANINASFAKKNIKKGKVGLVMQSGAFTTAIMDMAEKLNFGFSSIITLGNKACLNEEDFMEYFRKDKETETVVFYLENISQGRKFRKSLKLLAKEKKVMILKAGNSEKVKAAIQSHTGAMAGEIDIIKQIIKEAGAVYVDNISDLINFLKVVSGFKTPRNNKVVILTNAGGPGVIVTDLVENSESLALADISDEEEAELKKDLPPAGAFKNPIDILGDADSGRYGKALEKISQLKNVGSVFVLITPQAQTDVENISQKIIEANKNFVFPIFPVILAGKSKKEAKKILAENNLCNFDYPSQLIRALSNLLFNLREKLSLEAKGIEKDQARIKKAARIFSQQKNKVLYSDQATELCELYGIDVLKAKTINSQKDINEENWNFPVVLKVESDKILHKKDQGGVALNIKNIENLLSNYSRLSKKLKVSRFIAQPQIDYGLEIILGIKDDVSFGKVIMVGLGGTLAEVIGQKEIILLPTNKKIIKHQLERSLLARIFKKENLDLNILATEIEKLSILAAEAEKIKELDINPLVFYQGKPIALDIKVILK